MAEAELIHTENQQHEEVLDAQVQVGVHDKPKRPSAAAKKADENAFRIGKMEEKLDHLCLAMLGPRRWEKLPQNGALPADATGLAAAEGGQEKRAPPQKECPVVTDDSDDGESEEDITIEALSAKEKKDVEDALRRSRFDMGRATGKPVVSKAKDKKGGHTYPRPYMYLPRDILIKVKDRESYDQLTYGEYMLGYANMLMDNELGAPLLKSLTSHLAMVTKDATRYAWSAVIEFSNRCFDAVEVGDIEWHDREDVRELRMFYSWVPTARISKEGRPCLDYQDGSCDQKDAHDDGAGPRRHRCVVCWYGADLYECKHPATACGKRADIKYTHASRYRSQRDSRQKQKDYPRSYRARSADNAPGKGPSSKN